MIKANLKCLPLALLTTLGCNMKNEPVSTQPMPPIAKKVPHEMTIHGDTRIDEYFWLRDMKREDPEIIAYLNEENTYTDTIMASTQGLQTKLYDEMIARIKQDDESVPYEYDGYWYYTRFEEGKEYPIFCRKEGSMENQEQIMLNVNEMAEGYAYYQVGAKSVSTNNNLLAFTEDTLSRRIYTIRFKDLTTGEYLEDQIEGTAGGCTWANDNKTVFYTRKEDVTLRSYKVFKHVLGTDPKDDEEVFHEMDATFNVGVGKFKSKKWLVIQSYSTVSDEVRVLSADNPSGEWKVIQPRERNLEYSVDHYGDRFYILTNMDALNFRLMQCDESNTNKEHWTEVIPHRKNTLLQGVDMFENHMVLSERIDGQNQIRVRSWDGNVDYYIPFDEEVYDCGTGNNPNFKTNKLRLGYQSMTTPSAVYEFDMVSKDRVLLKQQPVLGDYKPGAYTSKRLWATARDGVKVPISLVYMRGTEINDQTPLLLYAYGSYGATIDPYFSAVRLSLLHRGFVFAIAHLRGGQMMGRQWYEDGKMLKKKNTFNDYIDCADHLIKEGYTSPDHLYAMGGSAGGLLMGAVINQRPDLWRGVVAAVPFVDVVTTMLDESIPLTTGEFDEWGNPKNEEYYWYIKSYSPYDNVEAKDYPNMLVTTGLHDSQVQYWEPAKWVARLRDRKTDNNLLMLKTNMDFGHSGASGRFESYKEVALEYAFILKLEGISD